MINKTNSVDDIAKEISQELKFYFWNSDDKAKQRNSMNKIAFLSQTAVLELEGYYDRDPGN